MQIGNTSYNLDIPNNHDLNDFIIRELNSTNPIKKNPVLEMFNSEGCEAFIDYIELLGLSQDKNIVVLSSIYHYYYDADEMKDVKTIINLKELNKVNDIKNFLHSIFHTLSPKSYFIGCFVDNENIDLYKLREKITPYQKMKILDAIENGILSRVPFLNRMYSILDLKTNTYMSRENVTSLMNTHGLKVINMTELYGLIYFCVQRKHSEGN